MERLPSYRLYRLDGAGKIIGADWIEAEGDDQAVREASGLAGGTRFELWDRRRLVAAPSRSI
jgi:hypothetical protein